MARTDTLGHFLTDLADAMREATGNSGTISPEDYDTEIAGIASGGGIPLPTKGLVVREFNNDGWATTIEIVGFTSLPAYYLGVYGKNVSTNIYNNGINRYLSKIILNPEITSLGDDCFRYITTLTEVNLPNSITSLGARVFYYDSNFNIDKLPSNLTSMGMYCFQNTAITIKTIPDTCTTLGYGVFNGCGSITQISMNNVADIFGTGDSNGVFGYCTSLKGVWVGSEITTIGRYAFARCTNLKKIYINLPRATVEAMTNYNYAFMNNASNVGIIVCNDDAGFITKAEFDAVDWSAE